MILRPVGRWCIDLLYYGYNLLSLAAIMNTIKEKFVPQRNITPNFIRFKSTPRLTQGRIVMASPPLLNRTIGMIPNNRNVALLKPAAVASKSTRKEYLI